MNLPSLSSLYRDTREKVSKFNFGDYTLPARFKVEYDNAIATSRIASYSKVDWADYSALITTTTGKKIYLPNSWFYIAAELSDWMGVQESFKSVFDQIFSSLGQEKKKEAAKSLKDNAPDSPRYLEMAKTYLSSNGYDQLSIDNFAEFLTNYSSWGGGKTIDRGDFAHSSVMDTADLLQVSQSAIADLAYQLSNEKSLRKLLLDHPVYFVMPSSAVAPIKIHLQKHGLGLPKPFLLLAGISGTGKSRFVKLQADSDSECYELVSVRPDWHEPSDLLGYVSRINGDRYVVTPFLKFLVNAWRDAISTYSDGKLILNSGMKTFWLCLDEMNLAPVEQYFADYLSVLETRTWDGDSYSTEALVKPSTYQEEARRTLREGLCLEEDSPLWSFFMEKGVQLPPNLVVAGTVNMDETTHGFSRKVIDRAYTIDFGEFFPNVFDEFFNQTTKPVKLSYSNISSVPQSGPSAAADPDGKKSIAFLSGVNKFLDGTPFQLAYRALNELLVTVACFAPADDRHLRAVWDDFLMAKLLPRIEGDAQKIGDSGNSLLNKLLNFLKEREFEGERPDLMRESSSGDTVLTPYRSTKKLAWMQNRLVANGFTSFWP